MWLLDSTRTGTGMGWAKSSHRLGLAGDCPLVHVLMPLQNLAETKQKRFIEEASTVRATQIIAIILMNLV